MTPRTDKQVFIAGGVFKLGEAAVLASFARELELELNELKRKHAPPISIYDLVLGYIQAFGPELSFPHIVYAVINEYPKRTDLTDFTIKDAIWSLLDDNKLQLTPDRNVKIYKK